MTDREFSNTLWRAFLLGARVVSNQNGKDLVLADIGKLGGLVREIAESDATLEDPTALAAHDPDIGPLLLQLGTVNIRNNRDLAKHIHEGFMIATEVKE